MSYITDVDLVRAVIEYIIDDSTNYVAGSIFMSTKQANIQRYGEKILGILDDKSYNKMLAKILVSNSGSSEITSLNSKYICSFGFNIRFDFQVKNLLTVLGKMRDVIENAKGRKFDIIIDSDGEPYVSIPCDGKYAKKSNIFIIPNFHSSGNIYTGLVTTLGLDTSLLLKDDIIYVYDSVAQSYASFIVGTKTTGVIPVTLVENIGTTFTLRKVSLSFNGIEGEEPRNSNGDERTQYFVNGNSTVSDENTMLGNDMVKFEISYDGGSNYIALEPLSIPSDVDYDSVEWRTNKDSARVWARNHSQSNKSDYAFAVDYSALSQFFYGLAKKGTYSIGTITPNTNWLIKETYNNFGAITTYTNTCILDKATTSNTNGDVMMVTLSFKVVA